MHHNGDLIRERLQDQAGLDEAVTKAARLAVLEHARLGFPVAEWRDGQVVWVPTEEILRQFAGTIDNLASSTSAP